MSECITVKKKSEHITFTINRATITAKVGVSSSSKCPDEIKITAGPISVKTDTSPRIRLTVSDKINVCAAPSIPRSGANLQVLDENTDPCDLVIAGPTFVLKKVLVGGCPKYKMLVVEPGP